MQPDDFPIRCVMHQGDGVPCRKPAVVALVAVSHCGCPPEERERTPACAECAGRLPVGYTSPRMQAVRCTPCGQRGVTFTIIEHDRLNEGDLPDAEPDPHPVTRDRDEPADGPVPAVWVQPGPDGRGVGSPPDTRRT